MIVREPVLMNNRSTFHQWGYQNSRDMAQRKENELPVLWTSYPVYWMLIQALPNHASVTTRLAVREFDHHQARTCRLNTCNTTACEFWWHIKLVPIWRQQKRNKVPVCYFKGHRLLSEYTHTHAELSIRYNFRVCSPHLFIVSFSIEISQQESRPLHLPHVLPDFFHRSLSRNVTQR